MRLATIGLSIVVLQVSATSAVAGPMFMGLGDLPGGEFGSVAGAVSADGFVVVGQSMAASSGEAFRWTMAGCMKSLGVLAGGASSSAQGVSQDGSVVVGFGSSSSGASEAFRWTEAGGMVALGDLPGGTFSSVATDVSGDGSVIVGPSYRWQSGSVTRLAGATAYGVFPDGRVVVDDDGVEAFSWEDGG